MALTIGQREREGIVILDLTGKLTIGAEDETFRSAVQACLRSGHARIILNCARLTLLDSVGVGSLVFCQIKLQQAGGKLALINLARAHMQLFVRIKLDRAFKLFADEQDAVNSFFPDRVEKPYDILEFVRELEAAEHSPESQANPPKTPAA